MRITFDPVKRDRTLAERGLDFARVGEVFRRKEFTQPDNRFDYGEERMITFGVLGDRIVVVVWTLRGDARHVISMRKANEREQKRYRDRLE